MKTIKTRLAPLLLAMGLAGMADLSWAAVYVQCPGDLNGDADLLDPGEGPTAEHPNSKCMHLTGGDGFITMADGRVLYTFGFSDVTGLPPDQVMSTASIAANFPAPTIALKEGQEFFLTLSNVGMPMRPDLFDPHSVHFHGFPNAATVFDGVPEASISINMGSSITYYYNLVEPGTYLYHCHVEATEHMQMGMLGNLYVMPRQNDLADGTPLGAFTHHTGYKYVYNDGDGSTYYDVDAPIQLASMDHVFHEDHLAVQPLPFALMKDTYSMMNGRGYPDTVNPNPLPAPAENGGKESQKVSSLITASSGQKIALRLSNLSVTTFYTVTALGLPMKVVGTGARLLRGSDGKDLSYQTGSVTLGGGESVDVIIDTAGIAPGRYFLYTSNLNHLTNYTDDLGGMMTEIVLN